MLGLACGGPAFTVVPANDSGVDATTDGGNPPGPDAANDGGPASDGSPQDGPVADVLEEPPPSCTGSFACVPAIPSGWMGPLEVYSGAGPAPACSTGFGSPQDANDMLVSNPATCGCLCGTPAMQCSSPQTSFFNYATATGCGANPCAMADLTSSCTMVSAGSMCTAALIAMSSPQAAVLDAGCPPQSTATIPQTSWGVDARACTSTVALAQLDCGSGAVCSPKPAAPFGSSICIASTGDVACPTANYTTRHVYYDGVIDTRGCSACSCTAQSFSCSATIDVYPSSVQACSTGMPISYTGAVTCEPVDQPADMQLVVTPSLGTCTPSQSTPTGGELPAKPLTVCCAP